MNGRSPSTIQLQDWIDRIQAGDETAYNDLVKRFYPRFLQLVRQCCPKEAPLRKKEDITDVLQQAFVKRLTKAMKRMRRPESRAKFMSFIYSRIRQIVVDLSRHHYKTNRRRIVNLDGNASSSQDPLKAKKDSDPAADPSKAAEYHELLRLIGKILTPKERCVFDAIVVEERSHKEIAEILSLDVETVKKRFDRAKVKLRTAFRAKGWEYPAFKG